MPVVKLNVGGEKFVTELSNLTKYPSSVLAKLFKSDLMQNGNVADDIFLDADPKYFNYILLWLRYGVLSIPETLDKSTFRMAAKHLGLEELVTQLDKESKGSMKDWLKLNVGGVIFETSRATLTSNPTSTLARMFEPNSNLPPAISNSDGVFLIDACPQGFGVVLNWLRYRRLMLGQVKAENVVPLADYFGLDELNDVLMRQEEKDVEESSKLVTVLEEAVDRIEDVIQQLPSEISNCVDKLDDIKIEVAGIPTALEDLWRIKCEISNIATSLS